MAIESPSPTLWDPRPDGCSTEGASFNHGFAYWIYGGMSVLAAAFVYFYVPETKRRTLEGIQHLWSPGEHMPLGSAAAAIPNRAAIKQSSAG